MQSSRGAAVSVICSKFASRSLGVARGEVSDPVRHEGDVVERAQHEEQARLDQAEGAAYAPAKPDEVARERAENWEAAAVAGGEFPGGLTSRRSSGRTVTVSVKGYDGCVSGTA